MCGLERTRVWVSCVAVVHVNATGKTRRTFGRRIDMVTKNPDCSGSNKNSFCICRWFGLMAYQPF